MLRHFIASLVVTVLVLSTGSASAAFKYEQFPDIPTASVVDERFVAKLQLVCKDLTQVTPLQVPHVCPTTNALPCPSRTLGEQMTNARALPVAAAAAPGVCPPQADVDMKAVVTYVNDLKKACENLRALPPKPLTDPDLAVLRQARDTPEILIAVEMWNKGTKDFREALKGSDGKTQSDAVPGLPSLGSLSDQLIRGMAEFLAKRAQQEALRYLRDDLKKQLCDGTDSNADLRKTVFVNTCAALGTLEDAMSLEAIGSYMRAAAEKDLKQLPDVALAYLEQQVPRSAEVTFASRLGLKSFDAIRRGREPMEVLYSIGEINEQDCESKKACSKTSAAVRSASALAYALRQDGSDWHEQFRKLKTEDRPVVAVAVLLLVEGRLGSLGSGRDLGVAASPFAAAAVNHVVVEPLALFADALAIAKIWENLQTRLEGNLSEDARRDVLADAMVESLDRITRLVESFDRLLHGEVDPQLTEAMLRTRSFVSIAVSLVKREYGAATVAALAQLKDVGGASGVAATNKYLPLVVEIATAQSSNEVAAAFDAYAAPIGTYKLKYKRPMVSINGFLGAHAGWERLDSGGVKGTSTIVGGFAPVGVHASVPISDSFHIGALLSVIDLGAVTSIKTDTDDQPEAKLDGADPNAKVKASDAPKIGFAQVFSPGAYLVLGIAGSPFVLGAGASLSPELREVTQDGLKTDVSALRLGGFLAIDVPFLPLN